MNLYKGKYLIALYDRKDNLVSVGSNLDDLSFSKNYLFQIMRRMKANNGTQYRLHFIDCTEKHNDIFAEEDDIFMQEMEL